MFATKIEFNIIYGYLYMHAGEFNTNLCCCCCCFGCANALKTYWLLLHTQLSHNYVVVMFENKMIVLNVINANYSTSAHK